MEQKLVQHITGQAFVPTVLPLSGTFISDVWWPDGSDIYNDMPYLMFGQYGGDPITISKLKFEFTLGTGTDITVIVDNGGGDSVTTNNYVSGQVIDYGSKVITRIRFMKTANTTMTLTNTQVILA